MLPLGNWLHGKHRANPVVIGLELVSGDLGGPALREPLGVGFHDDTRVAERSAADTGTLGHGHPLEETKVEPTVMLCGPAMIEEPGIAGATGIIDLGPTTASFQHEHARSACASRHAVTAPPKPLPTTTTSNPRAHGLLLVNGPFASWSLGECPPPYRYLTWGEGTFSSALCLASTSAS